MLQEKSMVVSLKICKWTATKHDKKITNEVKENHNASDDAGRYNKRLVAKEHLEAIQKLESEARSYHYENTLPWGENGERLLPSENFQDYIAKTSLFKDKFDSAVIAFVADYPDIILDAKTRLNGMFKESDYPSVANIKDKFAFKTTFMPVPDADFRVSLSEAEISRLRSSVSDEITTRITEAVKSTWTRIQEQLSHIKDRLSDPEAKFKNSLFGNLRDLIDLLPRLNVTGDENIERICTEMSGLLVDPEAVRNDSKLRSEKAQEVTSILNKFDQFFA
jgi:hypothetical protein